MPLFNAAERKFAEAVGQLGHCNPFTAERIACERAALGNEFDESQADWNVHFEDERTHPNLTRVLARCEALLDRVRAKIERRPGDLGAQFPLYEGLLLTAIYHRHRHALDELIHGEKRARGKKPGAVYQALAADANHYLCLGDRRLPLAEPLPHLFAGFFQIRRAFENIFRLILGVSKPAIDLRAAVWESIFTHDMRRYRRAMYDRMADFTTLVTGPSGTGKELVAQAIGMSRYIPFDETKGTFHEDFSGSFYPVNLSALSPTLIESELFGHQRGSFTGAIADRAGWLEVCPALGTVFLDEVGEVDTSIQVKLLRVLQSRMFSRLGESAAREFKGKIIAATNRDLAAEMRHGRFRHDFYYRLCSDIVAAPSLHARIADHPEELRHLVGHLAQRIVGAEGGVVAEEIVAWINANLGRDYAWPGNVRELEQCVRNYVIRKRYAPPCHQDDDFADVHDGFFQEILDHRLTADELLRRYCTLVYSATGSYEATARKLKLDRRTVRAKVDPELLVKLRATGSLASQAGEDDAG
jgi:transcriptional regulator with AAA-type ATPase domain